DRAGLRPDRAGGRLCARLPADRRGAGLRRPAAAEEDPPHRDDHAMSWPQPLPVLEKLGQAIVANSAGAVASYEVMYGELNLTGPANRVVEAMTLLRDNPEFRFRQLIDIAGADYPERERRFDVVYHLLSMTKNLRVRLKVQTDEDTPVPSVTSVYPCADWYERETFDM